MAAGDLCSLADVRLALELGTDTSRDSLISQLVTVYSAAIVSELNRQFAPVEGSTGTPVTHRFKLPVGQLRLPLEPYDLQQVTSITVSPESSSPQTLTVTDQVIFQPVTKPDGVWTSMDISQFVVATAVAQTAFRFGYALIDITGVWGFPTVPDPVRQACILAVTSAMRRDIGAFGMDIHEAEQYATGPQVSFGLPAASRKLLNNYRRDLVF
jgi:hypothetical protein